MRLKRPYGVSIGAAAGGIDALDEAVPRQAVLDDLLDRAHLEAVLRADGLQLGHAGHLAVVVDDLDEDRARVQSGQPREIDRSLGLPRAHQHAAVARPQRVDVAGTNEVLRRGAGSMSSWMVLTRSAAETPVPTPWRGWPSTLTVSGVPRSDVFAVACGASSSRSQSAAVSGTQR